jgi:hypothetical protein
MYDEHHRRLSLDYYVHVNSTTWLDQGHAVARHEWDLYVNNMGK